jgi:twitching motility protein PilI
VAVAFRIGPEAFLVPREEIREVMAYPSQITRVPGARNWLRGICSLRGQLMPIIDLRQYLGSGVTPTGRTSRVLVVNHRDVPAGLLVDEVLGFRRFSESEHTAYCPPTLVRCERYLAGAFRKSTESWPVLSLRKLVEDPSFLQAAA